MTTIRLIRTRGVAGVASLTATLLILFGCATTPEQPAAETAATAVPASDVPADPEQIEAANDSSTAIRAASSEDRQAYRDCVRRVRRTGSRLARSECEAAIFGGGFHSMNEAKTAPAGTITEPR